MFDHNPPVIIRKKILEINKEKFDNKKTIKILEKFNSRDENKILNKTTTIIDNKKVSLNSNIPLNGSGSFNQI